MPISKLWSLALRDLGRNRRRSLLTLLAVALGLALLIVLNGLIAGVFADSLQNSIRLRTGHVQLRAEGYLDDQLSLQAKDLLANPAELAGRAAALGQVKAAAPVIWASAMLGTLDDSSGVQLYGVDPASPIYAPIREAVVAGEFLTADDRSGVLIGKTLADSLGIAVGQKVGLALVNADGSPDEGAFTVRGLFATGIPTYDQSAALMPLSKAQAFTGVGDRASAIVILLNRQEDTDAVAAALRAPGMAVLTWSDLNQLFVQAIQTSMGFYIILDLIVMLIIANTLLMSVFERIREIGILSALGMKRREIRRMFLLEASTLGLAGCLLGLAIGLAGVAYLSVNGIALTDKQASVAGNSFALGTAMYARFAAGTFASLALATLLIVLIGSLYPAWYAARLEPIAALRAE